MLPLLALAVVAAQEPQVAELPLLKPADVADLLDSFALPFEPSNRERTVGAIVRGGVRVHLEMSVYNPPPPDELNGTVGGVRLSTELAFPEEAHTPDLSEPTGWNGSTTPTHVVSHLGRTATVEKYIEFRNARTRDGFRADLLDFWRTAESFALDHRGRFASETPDDRVWEPLPGGLVLDKPDLVSLRRVTDGWGWRRRTGYTGLYTGWTFPIEIDGREAWVAAYHGDWTTFRTSFVLEKPVTLPRGLDAVAWSAAHHDLGLELVPIHNHERLAFARRTIDLSHRPTLGNLRRQFMAFSRDLAALERTLAEGSDHP